MTNRSISIEHTYSVLNFIIRIEFDRFVVRDGYRKRIPMLKYAGMLFQGQVHWNLCACVTCNFVLCLYNDLNSYGIFKTVGFDGHELGLAA